MTPTVRLNTNAASHHSLADSLAMVLEARSDDAGRIVAEEFPDDQRRKVPRSGQHGPVTRRQIDVPNRSRRGEITGELAVGEHLLDGLGRHAAADDGRRDLEATGVAQSNRRCDDTNRMGNRSLAQTSDRLTGQPLRTEELLDEFLVRRERKIPESSRTEHSAIDRRAGVDVHDTSDATRVPIRSGVNDGTAPAVANERDVAIEHIEQFHDCSNVVIEGDAGCAPAVEPRQGHGMRHDAGLGEILGERFPRPCPEPPPRNEDGMEGSDRGGGVRRLILIVHRRTVRSPTCHRRVTISASLGT